MRIDPAEQAGARLYGLLTDSIIPRPIAWITTLSAGGVPNLAPFSFFTGVTARPPTLAVCIAAKRVVHPDGTSGFVLKDTARFISERGEFVVHPAPAGRMHAVDRSAENHREGVDVPALLGLKLAPGCRVAVPRLADLPVAMECRLDRIVSVGDPPTSMVLGEILCWHVDDRLLDADGRIAAWDPLARLGVDGYGKLAR